MQRRRPRRGQPGKRPAGAPVRVVSPHRIQILVALLAAATVLVYVAHAAYFRHYVNDDAYITFRYSRFLTLGRGPYFNVGEHVEGYTNPLFVLLMVPIIALGGEAAASIGAKTIGVLCGGLSLVAAFILFLRLNGGESGGKDQDGDWYWLGGVLAAGLIAVSPSYALNSMSGLETTLFGLCITAGVLLGTIGAQRGAWNGAGIAFAAGVLTRPEGIALFAVYWCAHVASLLVTSRLASLKRQLFIDAAIVVVVFAGQLVFRWIAYDGEWLPNTYYAKAGGFWAFDAWPYVRDGILMPLGGALGLVIAVVGYLLRGAQSPVDRSSSGHGARRSVLAVRHRDRLDARTAIADALPAAGGGFDRNWMAGGGAASDSPTGVAGVLGCVGAVACIVADTSAQPSRAPFGQPHARARIRERSYRAGRLAPLDSRATRRHHRADGYRDCGLPVYRPEDSGYHWTDRSVHRQESRRVPRQGVRPRLRPRPEASIHRARPQAAWRLGRGAERVRPVDMDADRTPHDSPSGFSTLVSQAADGGLDWWTLVGSHGARARRFTGLPS